MEAIYASESSVYHKTRRRQIPEDGFRRRLRVLRRIFGPKRDEVTGGWRGLHNSYSSSSIIRSIRLSRIRWAGRVAQMGEEEYTQDIGEEARRKYNTRKTET
jgi:hypothetical protein